MSLFQKSVLNKFIKEADQRQMKLAFEKFIEYFHNPVIQQNIRESKEEQFQEGFLRELFVNVLGYTINPDPDFNLTTEFKNERGAKKADGAILINGEAIGVIELKSTKTKDLESIRLQAFDYKANQKKCVYVVTSNFEKVRFYINNAVDFEEFDLFNLEYDDFQLLWLCLAKESLVKGIPLAIKEASILKEEDITKQIYIDYSLFKRELYTDLITNNLHLEIFKDKDEKEIKLQLFKKSQKLLDRFLFIFFGEDRGLLPPNSISGIIDQWEQLKELDEYKPLYERYRKYFNYLNTGWKGKKYEIYAYNGGLFASDEILDSISISDEVLQKHTKVLTAYDFETDVDVNILGHIFENSLNEIEEITAQIEGAEVDLKKSKRKKDGVFYTPKYITKYIVENTVGKLCNEKKIELEIEESEYLKSRKGRTTKKLKELNEKLDTYRNWLLSLTICDPACGSGAFLNQALDFLIKEHHYIDELRAKLLDTPMVFTEVENSILENNIYGVDINEESVEIAKLSLWLRTAQKGRKLTTLSNNIKCGNSLIDDPDIAGKKAFNWQNEFSEVFNNGGFDMVIGNPPYLNMTLNNTDNIWLKYYIDKYESIKNANSKNIYTLFNELSTKLIKDNSIISFIVPEGFLKTRSYNDCVNAMENVGEIYSAVYFEDWVFEDATTGSMIFEFVKNPFKLKGFKEYFVNSKKDIEEIVAVENSIISKYENSNFKTIDSYCDLFKGMVVKNRKEYISEIRNEFPNAFLLGNCIDRYAITNSFYCDYEELTIVGGTKKIEKHSIVPRILIRRTGDYLCCVMLKEPSLTESTLYSCSAKTDDIDLNYVLSLLNSKVLTYIVRQKMITNEQAFPQIMMTDIKLLKIPYADLKIQLKLCERSIKVAKEYSLFLKQKNIFIKYFQSKIKIEKLTKKLQNWHELEFGDFIKELNKTIKKAGGKKLSKMDEMEWMEVFETKKVEVQKLKSEIDKTDKEIDQMVYELYGLTEEEIKIVEDSI